MNHRTLEFYSLTRRQFLKAGAMASAAFSIPVPRLIAQAPSEYVTVATRAGKVRGAREDDVLIFRGVPYAGPVDGTNRFKEAPPVKAWSGTRDALTLGHPAIQSDHGYYGVAEPEPQENCLVLNVWTPAADNKRRPVMFYSHGGGFNTGSGGAVGQDGSNLARTYDVVVVSSNHRLGLLGFLYLTDIAGEEYRTSGNQGILDIQAALQWVRTNIASFGGDPESVLIFGESGGALKTSCLYAMPGATRLFAKASIESGPGIRMMQASDATEVTHRVLHELGLKENDWRSLTQMPVTRLLEVQMAISRRSAGPEEQFGDRLGLFVRSMGFAPVVDGEILPQHPFDPVAPAWSKSKPLIIGTNRDEMNFIYWASKADVFNLTPETLRARLQKELGNRSEAVLATYTAGRPGASPTDLYIAITTDRMWRLGSITIAERKYAQNGAPVFMYTFTHQSNYIIPGTTRPMGAGHATDLAYTFNTVHDDSHPGKVTHVETMTPLGEPLIIGTDSNRLRVAHNMSEMWTTFARTGHPGAKSQPGWPAYTPERRATMMIDAQCFVVDDPHRQERELWAGLDPLYKPA
jgi:para-nitrobenzyl esterase